MATYEVVYQANGRRITEHIEANSVEAAISEVNRTLFASDGEVFSVTRQEDCDDNKT